jgi:hypothetical protein
MSTGVVLPQVQIYKPIPARVLPAGRIPQVDLYLCYTLIKRERSPSSGAHRRTCTSSHKGRRQSKSPTRTLAPPDPKRRRTTNLSFQSGAAQTTALSACTTASVVMPTMSMPAIPRHYRMDLLPTARKMRTTPQPSEHSPILRLAKSPWLLRYHTQLQTRVFRVWKADSWSSEMPSSSSGLRPVHPTYQQLGPSISKLLEFHQSSQTSHTISNLALTLAY